MTNQASSFKCKAYVLGDNIDTDQIIPAQYLNLLPTIEKEYRELGSYALSGLPDNYEPFVKPGDYKSEYSIIIAGRNFGCGSSREHAPIALGAAGIKAVIAESYARIFFRNCIALGELYPLESNERLCDVICTGDEVVVDTDSMKLSTGSDTFMLKDMGAVAPVIEAGGIFKYARVTGMISGK